MSRRWRSISSRSCGPRPSFSRPSNRCFRATSLATIFKMAPCSSFIGLCRPGGPAAARRSCRDAAEHPGPSAFAVGAYLISMGRTLAVSVVGIHDHTRRVPFADRGGLRHRRGGLGRACHGLGLRNALARARGARPHHQTRRRAVRRGGPFALAGLRVWMMCPGLRVLRMCPSTPTICERSSRSCAVF